MAKRWEFSMEYSHRIAILANKNGNFSQNN